MLLGVAEAPRSGRIAGQVGFIFSLLTNAACLLGPGAAAALITYPTSIALRSASWFSTGKALEKKLLKATGLAVGILGAFFYLVLIVNAGEVAAFNPDVLRLLILLWTAYSVLEAASYLLLRGFSRFFLPALLSLPAIALAWLAFERLKAMLPYVLPLLMMSALAASLGFAKLRPTAPVIARAALTGQSLPLQP